MNTSVKVKATADGHVITPSKNNPEWGSVRVSQEFVEMENGFLKRKVRYAFIHGTISDLKAAGFKAGQELDGKIVVREQTSPFNTENPDADLKTAGESGVICSTEGVAIYRKSFYETNPALFADVRVAHDNHEEIKAAFAAMKSAEKKGELQA